MVCQLIEMFICLERIEWRKYNVNDYDRLRFCLMMSWWTRVHSSLSFYGRGGQRCSCQYEENCDVTCPVSHCWPAGVGGHGAGSRVTCHTLSTSPLGAGTCRVSAGGCARHRWLAATGRAVVGSVGVAPGHLAPHSYMPGGATRIHTHKYTSLQVFLQHSDSNNNKSHTKLLSLNRESYLFLLCSPKPSYATAEVGLMDRNSNLHVDRIENCLGRQN